jgi:hypothetical protein
LTPDCNTMIKHLFILALILIAVDVSAGAVMASGVDMAIPTFAQNMTSGNTTGGNSSTTEERGAYSEYGG